MDQHRFKGGGASALPILIFGLEEREDRWSRCDQICKEEEIEATYVKVKRGKDHRDSTREFLKAIKGKGDLLFFENDFELTDGWREVLQKSCGDLPLGWDVLYLGANLTSPAERVTDNLIRVKGAWMFHAVLLSGKFIDSLKTYNVNQFWVFDEWMRKVALHKRFYMTYPMISYQRKGYSDFAKKETYYDIFGNNYYKKI